MTLEEKVSKSMLMRDSHKVEIQQAGVDQTKEALWELILWLWGVQCQFMTAVKSSNPLKKEEAKVWRVRSISIMRTLQRDRSIDTRALVHMLELRRPMQAEETTAILVEDDDSNDSFHVQCKQDLDSVKSIYLDQHQLLEPLELVSRALTDSHFSKFLLKIPIIFTHYHAKCSQQTVELEFRVKQRVRELYWRRYCDFRNAFGLKLNYNLKYERGINVVQLVKRNDRQTFKPSLLENGEIQAPEVPIKLMEREMNKEKDQNDASFISDDLLTRSLTSKDSAFTLAHFHGTKSKLATANPATGHQ